MCKRNKRPQPSPPAPTRLVMGKAANGTWFMSPAEKADLVQAIITFSSVVVVLSVLGVCSFIRFDRRW